jgi:hypothetical protein
LEKNARRARDKEAKRKARELWLGAERKAGQLLIDAGKAGLRESGRATKGFRAGAPTGLPKLEDLGPYRKESQIWQRLAAIPQDLWDAALADTVMPTRAGMLRLIAEPKSNPRKGGAGALVPMRPGIQLPGTVTRTGWKLPKDMTFDAWLDCGQVLDLAEGAVQWWRGDWWAFGSGRQWGEGEALAEKASVNYETVKQYGSVCRAFELCDRSHNLTFNHHLRVMAAPAEERQAWLRRAETEGWSVAELRAALAQGKRLKVARQAELAKDGEKDGPQSEQTQPAVNDAPDDVAQLEVPFVPSQASTSPLPTALDQPLPLPDPSADQRAAVHATGPKSGKQILAIVASVRRRLGDDPEVLDLCDWIEAHAIPHDVSQEVLQTGRPVAHTNEHQYTSP